MFLSNETRLDHLRSDCRYITLELCPGALKHLEQKEKDYIARDREQKDSEVEAGNQLKKLFINSLFIKLDHQNDLLAQPSVTVSPSVVINKYTYTLMNWYT